MEAVNAAAASPVSTAALCSISTVNGVSAPGTNGPTAVPLSCAQAIANQRLVPSAIRSSSHRHA